MSIVTKIYSDHEKMGTYLGQNFLTDSKIRHRIGDKTKELFEKTWAKNLIEIWPGRGSLTILIKDIAQHFILFEKDTTLQEKLEEILSENHNAKIIFGDVLEKEIQKEWITPNETFIVGNLPYYITSPILKKFFADKDLDILWGLFMIQHEVWEKIDFNATKKSYLYRLLNYRYQVKYLKWVPAKAFNPAPKVKSCMISLLKREKKPDFSFQKLIDFLDDFSPYSRKTLGKITKILEKKGKTYHLTENFQTKRLEELSWEDLETIFKEEK